MNKPQLEKPAAEQIDDIIKAYGGWKGGILSEIRSLIKQADSTIIEEVKWKTASRPEGLPAWYSNGILCIAETWKDNIKLIFFKGAKMNDSKNIFNARLKSSTDRAIEFREDSKIDGRAIIGLIKEAVRLNNSKK